ncbi:hypothetical protein [Sporosarcina sp. G11-34]|uniref:hypothetical protein n=1 Tax=Sporosarcina sp. G11-34 TaxID=2849605 RepID=UPI0022A9CF38|nr:hypothetical protein [Sporosarcina sp. G11-34]MCZ2258026.1 hypothetical protein [Sporosarcina sp. G11-34]
MSMYVTVFLRIMLFVSLAVMVFDFLRVEQLFIQMERGYIDGFTVDIITWPGYVVIAVMTIFFIANIIQLILVKKNKNANKYAFLTIEYDVSDERAVENTRKAVSWAFVIILTYSFLILGSYMFVPNYFVDYIWYPLFTTASIPIVGLLTYLITYKVHQFK